MTALERADAFIRQNTASINPRYRPAFHLCAPVGWINDPNGFCFFQGRYHLFAQFHPYESVWGPMHWAHWTSRDLLNWSLLPVALAPDTPADSYGCFSGTVLPEDGVMRLAYTGAILNEGGEMRQRQCMAFSRDGVRFIKSEQNPVITAAQLPLRHSAVDFRDPHLMARPGGGYRLIAASRREGNGTVVSFTSEDLRQWTFEGTLFDGMRCMVECPDLYELDGYRVLTCSVEKMPPDALRYANAYPVVYMTQSVAASGEAHWSQPAVVDNGLDFYAPQSLLCPDERRVMIGWMHCWGKEAPTNYLGHHWAGVLTLPRALSMKGGRLLQRPIDELSALRGERTDLLPFEIEGETVVLAAADACPAELTIVLAPMGRAPARLNLLDSGEERVAVFYDPEARTLTVDRGGCGYPMREEGEVEKKPWAAAAVPGEGGEVRLHVFIDRCCVEVFVDDGALTLSSLCFPKGENNGISVSCDGKAAIRGATLWRLSPCGSGDKLKARRGL